MEMRGKCELRRLGSDDSFEPFITVYEAKAWLEDVVAGDFVDAVRADGGYLVPTGPGRNFVSVNGFAAPGSENDLGIGPAHVFGRDDALGSRATCSQIRKDVIAASAFDQFADPANAGDQWVVPFLEVNARADGDAFDGCKALAEFVKKFFGFALPVDHPPEQRERCFDLGQGALVRGEDGESALDEFGGQRRLHV